MEHMKSTPKWHKLKFHLSKECNINKEQIKQYEIERRRLRAITKRMIGILQYLVGQNLTFRDDSSNLYETNNGNFSNQVEVSATFHPMRKKHLSNIQRSNFKQSTPHYQSNHFQNKIINLFSKNIVREILNCI